MEGRACPREGSFPGEEQRVYRNDAKEAAFLLGGIGTGNVSVAATGEFRDWEIFNNPGKGNHLPYTFFAIWAKAEGEKGRTQVLEARPGALSPNPRNVPGLPRFPESRMWVRYPFLNLAFDDDEMPVEVQMEAFTPFIPLNPEDSGIPGAVIRYRLKNKTPKAVEVSVCASILNAVGYAGVDPYEILEHRDYEHNVNEVRKEGDFTGLYMYSTKFDESSRYFGSMCLGVSGEGGFVKPCWFKGSYWDGVQDFWDDFGEDGWLEEGKKEDLVDCLFKVKSSMRIGSVGRKLLLEPGGEDSVQFVLSWYFPNRVKGWVENCKSPRFRNPEAPIVRNHYAKLYSDAWDAGLYLLRNLERLEYYSRAFARSLYESSLPGYVVEALTVGITVLRSNTCFWLENGKFLGWEGCGSKSGNCFGSCTHVWNYAQTLAFLFPGLEKTMRRVEFTDEILEDGRLSFRMKTVFDEPRWDFTEPAADGQLGTIIRFLRDVKVSGDVEFLRDMWPAVKRALDYSLSYWDKDGDCLPDAMQHNTYDIEFHGANSLTASLMLGALMAGIEMARMAGDEEARNRYQKALEKGRESAEKLLWNGEYYQQKLDDIERYKYQYGTGCLSDQMLGQFLCRMAGLGYILPEERVKSAVKSIFDHNFFKGFDMHHNVQRSYVKADERGLVLCTWPRGGRPRFPFVYSDEVWTGVEYQAAALLIYEGYVEEGLAIVEAIRERHDGYRRNPWDEQEAGHHYARSMSSWAVLLALSGFKCDLAEGVIEFNPVNKDGAWESFFCCGKAWGVFRRKKSLDGQSYDCELEVLYGSLDGVKAIADGRRIARIKAGR